MAKKETKTVEVTHETKLKISSDGKIGIGNPILPTKLEISSDGNVGLNVQDPNTVLVVEQDEFPPISTDLFNEIDSIQTIERGKLVDVQELIYNLKPLEAIELLKSVQTIERNKVDSIIEQLS